MDEYSERFKTANYRRTITEKKEVKMAAHNWRFGVSRGVVRGQFCGTLEVCLPSEPLCSPARTPSRRDVTCKRWTVQRKTN